MQRVNMRKIGSTPLPNPNIPWTNTIGGRFSALALGPLGTFSLTSTFILGLKKQSFSARERSPATAVLNM